MIMRTCNMYNKLRIITTGRLKFEQQHAIVRNVMLYDKFTARLYSKIKLNISLCVVYNRFRIALQTQHEHFRRRMMSIRGGLYDITGGRCMSDFII